ncbi:DNA ligase [Paenibacillus solisilvae]|uniref:DNA ligase n=1 Tax=Paenibacillus solisilvae TaxID=2486751 RepID=A0ABW0VP78_9BACL
MKQPIRIRQSRTILASSGEGSSLAFDASADISLEAATEFADPDIVNSPNQTGSSAQSDDSSKLFSSASLPPLPEDPMAPISDNKLPVGEDWCYQLKWDGVRILARITEHRQVELYSRRLYLKNSIYADIVELLESQAATLGPCLLDGEIVWWDGVRANFQQVLKRERSRGLSRQAAADSPGGASGGLVYVLFDLLADRTGDIRHLSFEERNRRLMKLCPAGNTRLFVTDVFRDGQALWDWVESNHWEGVVSKKLSSTYHEGKKHRDWLKKKTSLLLDVDIVGLKWRNDTIASLIMEYEGDYLGSVSLGLNDALRRVLTTTFVTEQSRNAVVPCPFNTMPDELKREKVQWLPISFKCRVTGLERTSAGQLRHPKLVTFLPKDTLT